MIEVLILLLGIGLGVYIGYKYADVKSKKVIASKTALSNKHLRLFEFTTEWLKLHQENKNLVEFFEYNKFKSVIVYGASYLGECLIKELESNGIEVTYVIDKKKMDTFCNKKVCGLNAPLEEADAIVVTAFTFFDSIEEELLKVTDMPIISLDEILRDVQRNNKC